jgi:hypothetical protein
MKRTDNEQHVGEMTHNGRIYSVYVTDMFCLNKHKFHVIVDGSMSRYTSRFDEKFFNDVEQAFKER